MGFKKNWLRPFQLVTILVLLPGCETHLSPDEIKLIGEPPETMYFGSPFAFQFGVSGGEAPYRYRYIQNPDGQERGGDDYNPVELTIEETNDSKPSFWLRGVPNLTNEEIAAGSFRSLQYQVEVTDGSSTHVRTFDFKLQRNALTFDDELLIATEGTVSAQVANRLADQHQAGFLLACKSATERLFEKTTLPSGVTVYPVTYRVSLPFPLSSRVELFYEFESAYDSELPERASRNIGLARPGVDYLDEKRSVIFEPGEASCFIYLDVLDDSLIEGIESLRVVFTRFEGSFVQFDGAKADIDIRDNEPVPNFSNEAVTKSEGGNVQGVFSLTAPYEHPLLINVSVDTEESSADPSDYMLTPENGVITIAAGELSASYSLSLLVNDDDPVGSDDYISVVTDIDKVTSENDEPAELEPLLVSINEWPLDGDLDLEIVGSSANDERAVDMDIIVLDGTVTVLTEDYSNLGEERALLSGYYRDGTPLNLTSTGPIVLAKPGVSVLPIAVLASQESALEPIVIVVVEVDGLYADVHRGGSDFVVAVYKKDAFGHYTNQLLKQFGSNGDDHLNGAHVSDRGQLYVFGTTTGIEFEGNPGAETNNGGEDGFVYKIDPASGSVSWSRFLGTEDEDSVVSVDAGRRNFVALVSRERSDLDAFVRSLVDSNGIDNEELADVVISSDEDDNGRKLQFSTNGTNSFALFDSAAVLPANEITPSRTNDVTVLTVGDTVSNFSRLFTDMNDTATDLVVLSEEGNPFVVGHTEGEFEDNQKLGAIGSDAFIATMEFASHNSQADDTPSFDLGTTLQFGTAGDDYVIDVEEVSERKVMVLWSENHTEGNGATRYRVSAFSPEGEKLSPNP